VSTVGGVTFSGGSQKAACLDITAAATNPTKKPLYNADVFGRVYDTNGEAAIDDVSSRMSALTWIEIHALIGY
jgi:hypothetical protein